MITIDEFIQLIETQESRRKYDTKELREQFKLFDKVSSLLYKFHQLVLRTMMDISNWMR